MEPVNIGHRRGQFAANFMWQATGGIGIALMAFASGDNGPLLVSGFLAACGAWSVARLRDPKPALSVDEHGITDNTSYFPGGLVRWEEIASVDESTYMLHPVLLVRLHDIETYLERVPAWERGILRSNNLPFGTPLIIAQGNLNTPLSEVKQHIEEHRRAWEQKQAAQTGTSAQAATPTARHWWTSVPPEERAPLQQVKRG